MRNQRRMTIAVIAVVALAALAVLAVFAMGVRHVPHYPSVEDRPDPPLAGTLAYGTWDKNGRCLWVQDIGGARRQFHCDGGDGSDFISWYGFDSTGHLMVARYSPTGAQRVTTYDTVTFAELSSRIVGQTERQPDLSVRADGSRVGVTPGDRDGSWRVIVTQAGVQRTVLTMSGPDDYYVYTAQWSTGGSWLVVADDAGRYIVMAAAGDPKPRVLARDVDQLVWYSPSG